MKLQHQQRLTPQQISEWCYDTPITLNKPNPPTEEAVRRAKFVDKTYQWHGR